MPIKRIDFDIYQLKSTPENHGYLFSSLDILEKYNLKVELDRYKKIYEGSIEKSDNIIDMLENIYRWSNTSIHPKDYTGHSISISDIVLIKNEYWFCDDFGWKKLDI